MSTCSGANRLLLAQVMLTKGLSSASRFKQQARGQSPSPGPSTPRPFSGVSWHTTGQSSPWLLQQQLLQGGNIILAPQCDQVHCPCSSRHASTNLAALLCKAVKHLPRHSFERVFTKLESVLVTSDDDHGISHATGNSDGTQHADMVVLAALC